MSTISSPPTEETWQKQATELAIKLNTELAKIVPNHLTAPVIYKPSGVRQSLENKYMLELKLSQMIIAPMMSEDGKTVLALSIGSDGKPITVEEFHKKENEMVEQIKIRLNADDESVCLIIEEYNEKFKQMAIEYNLSSVIVIYEWLNQTYIDKKETETKQKE